MGLVDVLGQEIKSAADRVPSHARKSALAEAGAYEFMKAAEQERELLNSIYLVIPHRPADGVNSKLASMTSLWYGQGVSYNYAADPMMGFIELTRAAIAWKFLNDPNLREFKYLLMIDDDMVPPPMLPIMLARHDRPVVGSCAMAVTDKWGPMLCFSIKDVKGQYRFPSLHSVNRIPAAGLLEVGHVGTGAMMIRRDVLEAFTFEPGDIPFFISEDVRMEGFKRGILLKGEDITFCEQVRAKGFEIAVDMEAHVGHRKTMTLSWPEDQRDTGLSVEDWVLPEDGMPLMEKEHAG